MSGQMRSPERSQKKMDELLTGEKPTYSAGLEGRNFMKKIYVNFTC